MLLFGYVLFVFFKQKTAYEMRISDWSSDVCSSDLGADDELPFGEARAALDDRGDQVEPERRFAALELDLDAVGVEPVEAGEDRRQRVLAPVESGSVGIDPRYLAIAAAQIAAQCGHETEIIERSGSGETLRHR